MTIDALRRALLADARSVADIARRAGVPATTLYSFVSGASRSLRADTFQKVVAVMASASGAEEAGQAVAEDGAVMDMTGAVPVAVPVEVPAHLLRLAGDHGLDVPALLAEGGIDAVAEAGRKAFYEANKDAIEANRKHIETHGTFAERHGVFPKR